MTIYGDGEQARDFIYVEDVTRANIIALESNIGGVFNIATGELITINKLAKLILEITSSKSPIIHTDTRPGGIRHSKADVTKTIKILKWRPCIELSDKLKKTIKWFKQKSASS